MQESEYTVIWQSIWNKAKEYEGSDPAQIDAFFPRLQLQAFSPGFAMLTADNDFIKRWIESRFMGLISQSMKDLYGVDFTVAIEIDASSATPAPVMPAAPTGPAVAQAAATPAPVAAAPTPATAPMAATPVAVATTQAPAAQQNPTSAKATGSLVSGYSFENFVRGTSNSLPYSMALAVAETPGKPELNPLFIYGKSGLGKTHLLRAIQNYVTTNHPHLTTVYVDAMALVNDYADAAAKGSSDAYSKFKNKYENADMLLIDDVQGLQNKNETLNIVFQILNRMVDEGRQVVLAADRAPKNIDIEERYQSRFNSGGTCNVQPPEFETKLGIIRNYIEECGKSQGSEISMPWDVQEYIAQNSSSNIRELKSAVTKVAFEMSNRECDITLPEVERLLANHFSGGAMHRPTVGGIQKTVEEYYRISHADLVGKKRSANIAYARQIAIYLCRTLIDMPLSSIGTEFNRDHTTVMHSMKVVEDKIKKSGETNEELEILRRMIIEG